MYSDISHERQQSLLRQRNLYALTSAGLGLALVVAGSLAATRDRELVLVPTVPKALTVSSAGVEADYLDDAISRAEAWQSDFGTLKAMWLKRSGIVVALDETAWKAYWGSLGIEAP